MKILPANPESFSQFLNQDIKFLKGEGAIYIKVLALRPETLKSGQAEEKIKANNGILGCGDLQQLKQQINIWLDELIQNYEK